MIAKQTPLSSSAEPEATTTMIKNIDDFQEKLRAEQTKSVAALQKKDEFDIFKILFSTLEHQHQGFWTITTLIFLDVHRFCY